MNWFNSLEIGGIKPILLQPIMAKQDKKEPAYTVVKPFRDKNDFAKEHQVGDDVSHLGEERLAHLVSIGHVQAPETETPEA